MINLIKRFKNPLLFALALLPIAIVGGVFTCLYQFGLYPPEIMQEAIAQLGSKELLILITVVQTCGYALFCGFVGYILAEKIGLIKPFGFKKDAVLKTALVTLIMGVIFSLDYWVFGGVIPQIKNSFEAGLTPTAFVASVLYGGIIEEVMLRLFVMSLTAFIICKLFYKGKEAPVKAFVIANIVSALLFAVGHLPATLFLFGKLTPLILLRCFLYNGGMALVFGRLYRKYGIQYAMLAHIGVHIVSKVIWIIFV